MALFLVRGSTLQTTRQHTTKACSRSGRHATPAPLLLAAPPPVTATTPTQHTNAPNSAFEPAALREFVRALRYEPVVPVSGSRLGEVASREPWDGQDAAVELEDEFSLDDIMGGSSSSSEEEDGGQDAATAES